jgi:hypothetical protein
VRSARADDVARPDRRPRPARVRDALRGEALASFDRGSQLFADGDVAGARAEFLRAYTLGSDPRVLYNVAVCDKAQRRYARALRELQQSLDTGGGTLPKRYVQTVEDTLSLLRPLVTTLTLQVDEDGAAVSLDDEPVGTTPLAAPLPVEVGEHVVDVRKAGFHDLRERVEAADTPRSVSLQLEPLLKRGQLVVQARGLPATLAATAVVDGADVGPLPWTGMVTSGLHSVTARAAGYSGATVGFDVPYKQQSTVVVDMKPDVHQGRLRVTTDDADIFLDGKLVAHREYDGVVAAGEHSLRLTGTGSLENTSDILVREGETRSVSIQLAKSHEVPVWVWIAGGVVLASGATVAVVLLTEKTHYEGSSVGNLPPGVVPASIRFGGL